MKKTISLLLIFTFILTVLCSCKNSTDEPLNNTTEEYSSSQPLILTDNNIKVNESWKNNYVLKYNFYDNKQSSSVITECCNGKEYISIDEETGMVTYVTESDAFLIQYFLDPSVSEGTMSIITGNSITDLQSGFYLMSVVDKKLPYYTNTVKSGEVTVAGRRATQYIQTGTSDKVPGTMTAIICVDNEYGFVSKCELYDSSRTLLMKWELTLFSSNINDVNKAMPEIDLTDYKITSSTGE